MSELGVVLALLHDGPDGVRRLRAEVVSRVRPDVARAAWQSLAERSGAVGYAVVSYDEDPAQAEGDVGERRTRIWVDLDGRREREERTGDEQRLVVRRSDMWWSWDPDNGAVSNDGEDIGTSVAEDRGWILGGLGVIAGLRLVPLGAGTVAGRVTLRCRALRRPGADGGGDDWALHRLPAHGADAYELDGDAELGLILRVVGWFEGTQFTETEVVDVGINEVFADEVFEFVAPDGSPVRRWSDRDPMVQHNLRPDRLLELATFTVFVPGRVPEGWDASLGFAGEGDRPRLRASAFVALQSSDGLRRMQITEVPVDAAGDYDEWDHADPNPWQHTRLSGVAVQWREPRHAWQPARVRLERDGTRVLIDSTSEPGEVLLELAAGLVELRADRPDFGAERRDGTG